jgi:hypothetical protein
VLKYLMLSMTALQKREVLRPNVAKRIMFLFYLWNSGKYFCSLDKM